MPNIKEFNARISSLKSMQKVMRAMSMIATIKLRKLFRLQTSLNAFELSVNKIATDIDAACRYLSFSMTEGSCKIKKAHVFVFTADKGLCGSHNSSVYKALDAFALDNFNKNITIEATCIGKRGASYCKRKEYGIFHKTEINERSFGPSSAEQLASTIIERFLNNEIQQVFVIANYFVSTLHQETVTSRIIPFPSADNKDKKQVEVDTSIEPDTVKFLKEAGRLYLYYKLMSALFNSYLSEHSSRMTAMENATKNSEDLIHHYAKLQNRVRQANITNDLIEIISGKEALKG